MSYSHGMTNAQMNTTGINAIVGEMVHTHMWRNKVTQTALAAHLGIGQPAVARKLRGDRPFAIDELLSISQFLQVPITELLPNAEKPHPVGPGGGDGSTDLGLKVRSSNHLSYRGGTDDTNVIPMFGGKVPA